ncbi:hypothetical protein [Metabacillus sp. SLBN-84]
MNLLGIDEAADEESIIIVLLSFFLLNSYEASLGFEGVILVFLQKGYK